MEANYKVGEKVIFGQPHLFEGEKKGTIIEIEDEDNKLVPTSYAIKDENGLVWTCILPMYVLRFH